MSKLLSYIATRGSKFVDANVSSATAFIIAYRKDGTKSRPITPILNQPANFSYTNNIKYATLDHLEIWHKSASNMHEIEIEGERYTVPLPDWTSTKVYVYTSLPQHDDDKRLEQRQRNLKDNRATYELETKNEKLPLMLKDVPYAEQFSALEEAGFALHQQSISKGLDFILDTGRWQSIKELEDVFKHPDNRWFSEEIIPPGSYDRYKSDVEFGRQRIAGTNNIWIRKCTAIPDNFNVTDAMVKSSFKSEKLNSLDEALGAGRIFIIDHSILDGSPVKEGYETCAPIALFYRRDDKELVPIAIQLNQDKGQDNPVFLPSDPEYTWIIAKMWFNNADAAIHEGITHLGFTHLIMDGISAITHRNLALSHPIFKLLAPHFLNSHAINALALDLLVSHPDGILDKIMNIGSQGIFKLIDTYRDTWRMDIEGTVPADLKERGVDDADALPEYHFRDDALLVYEAIKRYVDDYLSIYYTTDQTIAGDFELQNWRKEMVGPSAEGGLSIKGVPGREEGKFKTKEEIALVLACIIYTSSAGHGAANFKQYDEYCFPPNYPLMLLGNPPTTKSTLSESDLLEMLADKKTTKETISIVKILSTKPKNALGEFAVNYIHDSNAQEVCKRFQLELEDISSKIRARNIKLEVPYPYLDPAEIPNSISV